MQADHNVVICINCRCSSQKFCRGLCRKCYDLAWQDDLLPNIRPMKKAKHGAPLKFISEHVEYLGDDCVLWPFAKAQNGYPEMRYRGKSARAHRVMCTLVHGSPPEDYYEASHTCERGHLGCVNPRHLVWETHYENHQRRAGRAATRRVAREERKSHPHMILE